MPRELDERGYYTTTNGFGPREIKISALGCDGPGRLDSFRGE
jgi:hypothetical protein